MNRPTQVSLVMLLLVLVAACSSHPKRVDCEGRLLPVNTPAPMKSSDPGQP
jgi:hypothetical protein